MAFRAFKVVSALPAGPLTPNAIYLVRVGAGVDLYTTNVDGVAFPLNIPKTTVFTDKALYDAYTPAAGETVYYTGA